MSISNDTIKRLKSKYPGIPSANINYSAELSSKIKQIKDKFYSKKPSLEEKIKEKYKLEKDDKQYHKFSLGRMRDIISHEGSVEEHLDNLKSLYNQNKPKIDAHRKWAKETSKTQKEYDQKVAKIDRYEGYLLKGIKAYTLAVQAKHNANPKWEKLISDSNRKLAKEGIISMPNLPAGHSCPGRGSCGSGSCYGMVGQQNFKTAIEKRGYAAGLTEHPEFIEQVSNMLKQYPKIKTVHIDPEVFEWLKDTDRFKDILRSEPRLQEITDPKTGKTSKVVSARLQIGDVIRLHDTGDFYNQDYVNKIAQIAKTNPDKKFYAYTKSLHLDLNPLYNLDNFHVIQSTGGENDNKIDYSKPHAVIMPEKKIKELGYVSVGDHDWPAASGEHIKIAIPAHGSRAKEMPVEQYAQDIEQKMQKSEDLPDTDWHEFDQPDLPNQIRLNNPLLFTVMDFTMKNSNLKKLKKATGYSLTKPKKDKTDIKESPSLDYSKMNEVKTKESSRTLDYSKMNEIKPKWKEEPEKPAEYQAKFKHKLQTKRREVGKGPEHKTAVETIQERQKKSCKYNDLMKCLKKKRDLKKAANYSSVKTGAQKKPKQSSPTLDYAKMNRIDSQDSSRTIDYSKMNQTKKPSNTLDYSKLNKDDEIPGGYGDNKDLSNFDKRQLTLGMLIELEHTNDFGKALEISKDHLMEDPEYYTHLIKMEKENLSKSDRLQKDKKRRMSLEELRANLKKKPVSDGRSREQKIQDALDRQNKQLSIRKQTRKKDIDSETKRQNKLEERILRGSPDKPDKTDFKKLSPESRAKRRKKLDVRPEYTPTELRNENFHPDIQREIINKQTDPGSLIMAYLAQNENLHPDIQREMFALQTYPDSMVMQGLSKNKKLHPDIQREIINQQTHPDSWTIRDLALNENLHPDIQKEIVHKQTNHNSGAIENLIQNENLHPYVKKLIQKKFPSVVFNNIKKSLSKSDRLQKDNKRRMTLEELKANLKKKPVLSGNRDEKIKAALERQGKDSPYSGMRYKNDPNITTSSPKQSARSKLEDRIDQGQFQLRQKKEKQRKYEQYAKKHGAEMRAKRESQDDIIEKYYETKKDNWKGHRIPGSRHYVQYLGQDENNNHRFSSEGHDFIVNQKGESFFIPELNIYSQNRGSKAALSRVKKHPKYLEITGKKRRGDDISDFVKDFEKPRTGWRNDISVRQLHGDTPGTLHNFEYNDKTKSYHPSYLPSDPEERSQEKIKQKKIFENIIKPHLEKQVMNMPHGDNPVQYNEEIAERGHLKLVKALQKLSKKQGVPKGVDPKKHERCVMAVKKQKGDKNPYAICNASLQKGEQDIQKERPTWKEAVKIVSQKRKQSNGLQNIKQLRELLSKKNKLKIAK